MHRLFTEMTPPLSHPQPRRLGRSRASASLLPSSSKDWVQVSSRSRRRRDWTPCWQPTASPATDSRYRPPPARGRCPASRNRRSPATLSTFTPCAYAKEAWTAQTQWPRPRCATITKAGGRASGASANLLPPHCSVSLGQTGQYRRFTLAARASILITHGHDPLLAAELRHSQSEYE